MSLNKTLDRLFEEIRREAKRNPAFADRLDAALRLHGSRREVPAQVLEEVAGEEPAAPSPPVGLPPKPKQRAKSAPEINPAGLYKRQGAAALRALLTTQDLSALRALVAEHNLDPGEITATLTRDELAAHIVAQAQRRAERDEKMFDY